MVLGLNNEIPGNDTYQYVQDSEGQVVLVDRIKFDTLRINGARSISINDFATLYTPFRCGYRISIKRYVSPSVRQCAGLLVRQSVLWSVRLL